MKDMLLKLYDLPKECVEYEKLKKQIDFRRPLAAEKYLVNNWVNKNFGEGWKSEVDVSFSKSPISTYIAIKDQNIIGFSSYDSAYLNFLGPIFCAILTDPILPDLIKICSAVRSDGILLSYSLIGKP